MKDEERNAYYIRFEMVEICNVSIENQLANAGIDKKSTTASLLMDAPRVAEKHAQIRGSLKFIEPLKTHMCIHDNSTIIFSSNVLLQR